MRKTLTITLSTAILAAGSLLAISAQAAPTASRSAIKADHAYQEVSARKHAHRYVVRQGSNEFTSFSSSSVGVNHPAKK
jgi:hypothetical protein